MKCASLCRQVMCRSKREGKHKAAQQVLQVTTTSLLPSDRQPSPVHSRACLFMQICSSISSTFRNLPAHIGPILEVSRTLVVFLCVCCRKCTRTSRAGAPSCACTPATWRRRKSSRCVPRQSLRRTPALLVQLVFPTVPAFLSLVIAASVV